MRILAIGLVFLLSMPVFAEVVQKMLGDINKDGKIESAIETIDQGASSFSTEVKIVSGKTTLLTLPLFNGDTEDGYCVLGTKIVVWQGDWYNTISKWKPHFYDFIWYSWDAKRKVYVQVKEGFTISRFEYKKAKKSMPILAASQDANKLVLSHSTSFAQDAIAIGSKKFGQQFKKATLLDIHVDDSLNTARSYVLDQTGAYVTFWRNGNIEVDTMDAAGP